MNTDRDSIELRDERDGILLNYDADARVTNHEGRMGNFYVEYVDVQPRWVYYELPLQNPYRLWPGFANGGTRSVQALPRQV